MVLAHTLYSGDLKKIILPLKGFEVTNGLSLNLFLNAPNEFTVVFVCEIDSKVSLHETQRLSLGFEKKEIYLELLSGFSLVLWKDIFRNVFSWKFCMMFRAELKKN